MRWWEKLSRLLSDDPVDVKACSKCMYWTPIEGVAAFCRCRNLTSKHYNENTPCDFGCDSFIKFGSRMDDTPVEIPQSLHRKRTERNKKDED